MIDEVREGIQEGGALPPLMPWAEFAAWTRTEPGVVRGWIDKGHLPMVRVGKRRMVNIVALVDQLREGEQ